MFGARAPASNTTEYFKIVGMGITVEAGDGRTAKEQAGYQMAGLVVALAIALLGGFVTGNTTPYNLT